MFMMHLRVVFLFALFLLSSARRTTRIDDSHQVAQQRIMALSTGFDVSAAAREAFLPGGVGPQFTQGRLSAHYGPHRARVALGAASGPEENQLLSPNENQLQAKDKDPEEMPEDYQLQAKDKDPKVSPESRVEVTPEERAQAMRDAFFERTASKLAVKQEADGMPRVEVKPEERAQATREAFFERTASKLAVKQEADRMPVARAQELREAFFERVEREDSTAALAKQAKMDQVDEEQMRAMAVREAFLERVALDKASKLLVKPEAQAQALRAAFFERADRARATRAADEAAAKKAKEESPKALAMAQADREARARAQAIREAYFERDAAFQAEKAARPEWKLQLPRRNIAWFGSEERAQNLRKAEALREAYSEGAGVEDQRWLSQVQDTPSLPQGKRRKPLSGSLAK